MCCCKRSKKSRCYQAYIATPYYGCAAYPSCAAPCPSYAAYPACDPYAYAGYANCGAYAPFAQAYSAYPYATGYCW